MRDLSAIVEHNVLPWRQWKQRQDSMFCRELQWHLSQLSSNNYFVRRGQEFIEEMERDGCVFRTTVTGQHPQS